MALHEPVEHEMSWLEVALTTSIALVVVSIVGQYCLCITRLVPIALDWMAAADCRCRLCKSAVLLPAASSGQGWCHATNENHI